MAKSKDSKPTNEAPIPEPPKTPKIQHPSIGGTDYKGSNTEPKPSANPRPTDRD